MNIDDSPVDPAIAGLARLELDRDVAEIGEREQLHDVAGSLASSSTTDYQRVVAVNSWVSNHLRYRESPATRSPLDVLQDQSGDCDDYTALTVALLRAIGIPAHRATGLLYDFNTLAAHAWVEVALPTRDGEFHWFINDPTLAGTTPLEDQKAGYVQFKDRILFYPVRPAVAVEGLAGRRTIDVLLNWRTPNGRSFTEPRQLNQFIDLVIEDVDREISGGAERLAEAGLELRRESASIAGSPYLLVDRPVIEENSSRLQMRLENEERLAIDLTAGEGSALESKSDLEVIGRLRTAYRELNDLCFAGDPAHSNLELVFIRDRHTDRLHTVSLRIGRYLVEHFLDRILKRLSKNNILTGEETAMISGVAEASGGRNLYALQELARRLPVPDPP